MVWGAAAEDFVTRWAPKLRANDPKLHSLAVLPTTRLAPGDVSRLAEALRGNTTLTDLSTSGHPLTVDDAANLARLLHGTADPADADGAAASNGDGDGVVDGDGASVDAATGHADAAAASGSTRSTVRSTNQCAIASLAVGNASTGDAAAIVLLEALARDGHPVRNLDLSYKGLTEAAGAAIAAVLAAGPVTSLSVARNELNCEGAKRIADALQQAASSPSAIAGTKTLESLDLSNTGIAADGADLIAAAIARGEVRLRSLRLGGNEIGPLGARGLASAVAARGDTHLRELRLSGCALGDEAGAELLRALCACSTVTFIDVERCGLGPAAAAVLGEVLATSSMETLVATGNPAIGDDGACAIALGLGALRLARLDLGECDIRARGYHALAAAEAPALRELVLFGNPAGNEGVDALATAAARVGGTRRGIRLLDLGGNGITARGFASLCDTLRRGCFPDIAEIDIGANAAEDEIDEWQVTADAFAEDRPHMRIAWRVNARPDGNPGGPAA
jgi:hypothetical protein